MGKRTLFAEPGDWPEYFWPLVPSEALLEHERPRMVAWQDLVAEHVNPAGGCREAYGSMQLSISTANVGCLERMGEWLGMAPSTVEPPGTNPRTPCHCKFQNQQAQLTISQPPVQIFISPRSSL